MTAYERFKSYRGRTDLTDEEKKQRDRDWDRMSLEEKKEWNDARAAEALEKVNEDNARRNRTSVLTSRELEINQIEEDRKAKEKAEIAKESEGEKAIRFQESEKRVKEIKAKEEKDLEDVRKLAEAHRIEELKKSQEAEAQARVEKLKAEEAAKK